MRYITIASIIAIAAPILAAPTAESQLQADIAVVSAPLEARANTVTCKPSKNKSKTKSFVVDVDHAKSQASKAAFTPGKSGDPHRYNGVDSFSWGVKECDTKGAAVFEYPVYWVGTKGKNGQLDWEKDTKTNVQTEKKGRHSTPIRVVYVNQNGGAKFCGIMTHSEVTDKFVGKDFFQKCT